MVLCDAVCLPDELERGLGAVENAEGTRARAVFTRAVLLAVASEEDLARAEQLARLEGVGVKLGLEILARVGWCVLERERCERRRGMV